MTRRRWNLAREAKIAGRAVEMPADGEAHAFRIDLEEVVVTRLNEARIAW